MNGRCSEDEECYVRFMQVGKGVYMNTTSKAGWLVVLLLWVLAILPTNAQSGLIHHKVMVSNPTMHKINVSVVAANDKTYTKEIMPYAFDTFDVGAHCPSYLKGKIILPTGTLDIVLHCIGTSAEGSADWCFFTCSSSSWDIVKKSDGAYHFRKL